MQALNFKTVKELEQPLRYNIHIAIKFLGSKIVLQMLFLAMNNIRVGVQPAILSPAVLKPQEIILPRFIFFIGVLCHTPDQHYYGRKPSSALGKPMATSRLLEELPT